MKTLVEFRSDMFPAYENEDQEINSGRHGKRVAEFLAAGLQTFGFETGDLTAEDWGWMIPIKNNGFKLWICCGNYEEYSDGFLCFIEPHTPTIRVWFKKIETQSRVEELRKAMDKILSECPEIRDKRWWTQEEFNTGKA